MVQLNLKSDQPYPHFLISQKKLKGFKNDGSMKECYITKMSDNRFAVFARSGSDYFYLIVSGEKELHETFTEQLTVK